MCEGERERGGRGSIKREGERSREGEKERVREKKRERERERERGRERERERDREREFDQVLYSNIESLDACCDGRPGSASGYRMDSLSLWSEGPVRLTSGLAGYDQV